MKGNIQYHEPVIWGSGVPETDSFENQGCRWQIYG